MIESAVVGVGECDDDVALLLNDFLIRHAVLVQDLRRDHARLVPHKVGTPKRNNSKSPNTERPNNEYSNYAKN